MAEVQKDAHALNYSTQFDLSNNQEIVSNLQLDVATDPTIVGIQGDVVTQLNEGIAGATVKLFDLNFNPIMHTVTDEFGKYVMTGMDPGTYLIFAVKDGYKLSYQRQTIITDTLELEPSIVLNEYPTGQRGIVYGIARDKNGDAVEGLKVNLYSSGVLEYTTLTADDGEYIIYGITPGEYTIEAYGDNYKTPSSTSVTVVEDVPLCFDIVVQEYTVVLNGTINGIITEKTTRNPIENALVALYKVVNGVEVLTTATLTDELGRYFFGNVDEGTYLIKAKSNKINNSKFEL